jgi:hypothetical protein
MLEISFCSDNPMSTLLSTPTTDTCHQKGFENYSWLMDGSRTLSVHIYSANPVKKLPILNHGTCIWYTAPWVGICGNETANERCAINQGLSEKMTTDLFHGYPSTLSMFLSTVFIRCKTQRTMLEGMQILLFSPLNHFQGK